MNCLFAPSSLSGTVAIPASKSVAHRAYLCAALAAEPTNIICNSDSVDILATRACLSGLQTAKLNSMTKPILLDCKESGSTLRFLLPLACAMAHQFESSIAFTGADYLAKRPLSPLVEELRAHGAKISAPGTFPLYVNGKLESGIYTLPGNISSQYISGLLMALPLLSGDSEIHITGTRESLSYIKLTLDVQKRFGICITETAYGYAVPGNQVYRSPGSFTVEADWSSAAFWLAAGAISESSPTLVGLNLYSAQGDRSVLSILEQFGAKIHSSEHGIQIQSAPLHGIEIDASDIPDLVPILAVVAAHAEGETRFIHASRLRLKESDRIASTEDFLQHLGFRTESEEDTLTVYGKSSSVPVPDAPIRIDSYNDHRIAMSIAIAALVSKKPVLLSQSEAVNKSYPTFYEHYISLGGRVTVCTPE